MVGHAHRPRATAVRLTARRNRRDQTQAFLIDVKRATIRSDRCADQGFLKTSIFADSLNVIEQCHHLGDK